MSSRFLAVVLLCALPDAARAQPTAWVTKFFPIPFAPQRTVLEIYDMASGELVNSFETPAGVTFQGGAFTPDARWYLQATNFGLARFDVATRGFVDLFGPQTSVGGVWVSRSGAWVHVGALDGRYFILNAATGSIAEEQCCIAMGNIRFSPDGTRRYAVFGRSGDAPSQRMLTAYADTPGATALWQVPFSTNTFVVDATTITFLTGGDLVQLDATTGAERTRVRAASLYEDLYNGVVDAVSIMGLAQRADTLLLSLAQSFSNSPPPTDYLIVVDATSLTRRAAISRQSIGGNSGSRSVLVSDDHAAVYWTQFTSLLGLTVSSTGFSTVDPSTNQIVANGILGSRIPSLIAIEPRPACFFAAPTTIDAPASGGIVEFTVVPRGSCAPWTVRSGEPQPIRVLNPGPHPSAGEQRIQVAVPANRLTTSSSYSVRIGGIRTIRVAAEAAVPGAPTLQAVVEPTRQVRLTWVPGPNPSPVDYRIRAGLRGQALTAVAAVGDSERSWISPELPPGSYAFEVVGVNGVGSSQPSNRIEISIDEPTVANAPTNLVAVVTDDVVYMKWQAASTGAAPASYILEGAPVGSTAFGAFATTTASEFRAVRVPTGSWQVRISAVTLGGISGPSNVVTFTTARCAQPPAAPVNLFTQVSGQLVTLQWTAPASGSADAYVLEAGLSRGSANLARFTTSTTDVTFEVPAPSGLYFVRVRARNACGESAPSNEVIVFVP